MDDLRIKRFRIRGVEGPIHRGILNQFHDFILDLDLDPGEPFKVQESKVAFRFTDRTYSRLAYGDPSHPDYIDDAKARVAHLAQQRLKAVLHAPGGLLEQIYSPSEHEADELPEVDPERVPVSVWINVSGRQERTNRVFISCGQQTEEEIALGQRIVAAVQEIPGLEPYFAENQQSLDGVTRDIFQAIYTSSGFIAVMHRRDQIPPSPTEFRGSVWIEQEIAIAAFLVQALSHPLPARAYVETGIRTEGVRGFILLNPFEFATSEEVLADLEEWLPSLSPLDQLRDEP